MGYDYTKKLKPVGQADTTACWAASISWWTQAMSFHNKRRGQDQLEMMTKFSYLVAGNGTMPLSGIRRVCESAEIRITLEFVTPDYLKSYEDIATPMLIVFNYPQVGGTHMNVIFNMKGTTVACMEPYYPLQSSTNLRTGKYIRRQLSFFCNSPEIGIGYLPLADSL